MQKSIETYKFAARWSKSLTDDSIGVDLKFKQVLSPNHNLKLAINESFLTRAGVSGRLSKALTFNAGICIPLKAQKDETNVLIENPFYFKLMFST